MTVIESEIARLNDNDKSQRTHRSQATEKSVLLSEARR